MCVPPYNWRVPYVVVCGVPNAQLKNLVCSPEETLRRGSELRLNYVYYMTKCINPALDRVLSLCGGDVFGWFKSVSRPKLRLRHINYDVYDTTCGSNSSGSGVYGSAGSSNINGVVVTNSATNITNTNNTNNSGTTTKHKRNKQTSMDQFTTQGICEICTNDALPLKTLCTHCTTTPHTTLRTLTTTLHTLHTKEAMLSKICNNCAKHKQHSVLYLKNEVIGPDCCESLDCQIMYERARLVTRLEDVHISLGEIEEL